MRQLLFAFIFLFSITIISCSDSGTGPSNEDTTTFSVAIDLSPSEAGSISPSAEDDYEEGEEIELQANPNDGYVFTEWTGDIESTDNPYSLTVDQDYNITANFEIKSYELTINKEGEGSVIERIVQQKSTEYDHGTVVELTAEPQDGYEFMEWQGDLSGTQNPSQITVDNPKNVTAVFEVATYPLSIDVSGEGSVTVTPDQDEYEYGTEVEILAEPSSSDWEFESWEGDTTSTNNPITVSVDSSINITGKFANTLFAGGAGTENNPYKIATIEQLQSISEYLQAHYLQTNNIDASVTENWNNGKGFIPIGNGDVRFTGVYDGNNFEISNLTIGHDELRYGGLFGFTTDESVLKNISMSNIQVTGYSYIGGLVGYNKGVIENVNVSGQIDRSKNYTERTGGLVGHNEGSISSSITDTQINGMNWAGGIAATNAGSITNSSAKGDLTGNLRIGGLVGTNTGDISNSHATGNISGEHHEIGGLVGSNSGYNGDGKITNSYAEGKVTGEDNIGGLVGSNPGSGQIVDSYSLGNVVGNNKVGGLVGGSAGVIENSSAEGTVTAQNKIGGLVGINNGKISKSKSSGSVEGSDIVGGLVGMNRNLIELSTSSGNITGSNKVGGLVGENYSDYSVTGQIKNAYSTGSVSGEENVGGFAGFNSNEDATIEYSFSTGSVSGTTTIGGFIGTNGGNLTSIYWDVQNSGISSDVGNGYSDGSTGLNTSEMTDSSAQENMSEFNWSETWVTTDSYPALFWEE